MDDLIKCIKDSAQPRYRAWVENYINYTSMGDVDHKKCHNVDSIHFNTKKVMIANRSFHMKDVILMQYIGIKDALGIDICVGDILKYEDENLYQMVVYCKRRCNECEVRYRRIRCMPSLSDTQLPKAFV